MLAHEGRDRAGIGPVEAEVPGRGLGERRALGGVVPRPGALAEVVQQGGDQEQVGSADAGQEALRLEHGLDLVAVHGEAVHGRALGPVADHGPARHPAGEHALDVKGLIGVGEVLPGEGVDEHVALGGQQGRHGLLRHAG